VKFSDKVIIAGLRSVYAKDLSDEEVLSLYKKVKEKLESQNKDGNQVLDGTTSGPEPQEGDETGLLNKENLQGQQPETPADKAAPLPETPINEVPPPSAEKMDGSNVNPESSEAEVDESIDQLLNDLGLGDTPPEETQPAEVPAPVEKTETPAEKPEAPADAQPEKVPAQTEEKQASKKVKISAEDIDELIASMDLESTENVIPEEKNEMVNRLTDKIIQDDPFSTKNFITAAQGLQVNRKDKDMMADGIIKPKYDETDLVKPPRTECRDPNGVRYKKNEDNRDPDTDSDPDLKTAASSNHKDFDTKKEALDFLKDHGLMSVGWKEGNKNKVAIYWNGKLHIEDAGTKKYW